MLDVTNRLATREKVGYLANLFRNTVKSTDKNFDEYEEYLQSIAVLSYREIKLLYCLYQVQKKMNYHYNYDAFERFNKEKVHSDAVWEKFIEQAIKEYGLDKSTIVSIISRTMNSGFVLYIPIGYAGGIGGVYITTSYFENFLKRIQN